MTPFMKALRGVWSETEYMCSKNFQPAIAEWLVGYERLQGQVSDTVREKLLRVSAATVDRLLAPWRALYGKGCCGTKPGTLIRTQIPIRTDYWMCQCPALWS